MQQEADKRGGGVEALHGGGATEGEFPAEGFFTRREKLAPKAELRGHPADNARVVPSGGRGSRRHHKSIAFGRDFVAGGFE